VDVIDQILFNIEPNFRDHDLYREYMSKSFELFIRNIDKILKNSYVKKPQDWIDSTYYPKKSLNFTTLSVDLNQTAATIRKQIYAFSFREYQLPKVMGKSVVEAIILDSRSSKRAGTLISEKERSFIISTIDYDLELFYDGMGYLLNFSNCSVAEAALLIKNLAGVNDRNHMGWSPLIVAAYNGNREVLDFLLDSGALVDDENYNGTTVLMYAKDWALKQRDRDLFDRFVECGANLEAKDFFGKRLRDYCSASELKFLGIS
jgi:methionyl-tRNA formyltransferase